MVPFPFFLFFVFFPPFSLLTFPPPFPRQHYSPSVITSLDEQDALSHFFQYRGSSGHFLNVNPLGPVLGTPHGGAVSPAAGRISSIVSAGALREGHGGTVSSSSTTLPGCRPDIISLD